MEIGANLDAINNSLELAEYGVVYAKLAEYANTKAMAVHNRLHGDTSAAILYESKCDVIYSWLPDWAKTW